jgi:anti-sigma factor RsiW
VTPEAMPHGTDEHPDVTELSDLAEGVLPTTRRREVREHLEHCPLCADTHTSLHEIRDALGSLPGPPRMPDDVAGRIDAALAAEALLDAEREGAQRPTPVSRETEPDEPARVSRETHRTSPARDASASRPAGHAPGRSGPGRTRRRAGHYRALLTAAGAVGALVLGGALLQGITGGSASDAGGEASEQRGDEGAVAAQGLEQRVDELLSRAPATEGGQPDIEAETTAPGNAPLAGGPAVVPSCVRAGIDRPEQPLAAEPGQSYAGRPSYLVVLPHPGDMQRVDAYVVDSTCTTEGDSGPGEVLVERTFHRD